MLYRLIELGNCCCNWEPLFKACWYWPCVYRFTKPCNWSPGGSCMSDVLAKVLLANVFTPSKAFLFLGNFLRISWYIFLASSLRPSFAFLFASFSAISSFNSSKILGWVGVSSSVWFLTSTDEPSLVSIWSKASPFAPVLLAWSNTALASAVRSSLIRASI